MNLPDFGFFEAFAFFLMNPSVVTFVSGIAAAVAVMIGLLHMFRRWEG